MATMVEDDISLNHIEGGDALGVIYIIPDIRPTTRDIMWQFPCTPEVAGVATKAHAFRKTFGTPLCATWKRCGPSLIRRDSSCFGHCTS